MTVIKFPSKQVAFSNGAREALAEIALTLPNETSRDDAEAWADWVLMELAVRGYIVVLIDKVPQ